MTVKELYEMAVKNGFADYKIIWKGGFLQTITGMFISHVEKTVYVW